jgi:hypothetical protein
MTSRAKSMITLAGVAGISITLGATWYANRPASPLARAEALAHQMRKASDFCFSHFTPPECDHIRDLHFSAEKAVLEEFRKILRKFNGPIRPTAPAASPAEQLKS